MLPSPLRILIRWVSCVETAFRASAVPRYAESPIHPSRDWKGTVSTCAVPQSWVSCSVDIAHFTVYTIQVGTDVRGNIFHGVTHEKCHRYHKLQSRHLARRLRIFPLHRFAANRISGSVFLAEKINTRRSSRLKMEPHVDKDAQCGRLR